MSSGFSYKDDDNNVFTGYLQDDGYGNIEMWKVGTDGEKIMVYSGTNAVGTVDYETGLVELKEFRPIAFIADSNIKINVQLADKNVFASRSRILTIDGSDPQAISLSIQDKASAGGTSRSSSSGTSSSSGSSGTSSSSSGY